MARRRFHYRSEESRKRAMRALGAQGYFDRPHRGRRVRRLPQRNRRPRQAPRPQVRPRAQPHPRPQARRGRPVRGIRRGIRAPKAPPKEFQVQSINRQLKRDGIDPATVDTRALVDSDLSLRENYRRVQEEVRGGSRGIRNARELRAERERFEYQREQAQSSEYRHEYHPESHPEV